MTSEKKQLDMSWQSGRNMWTWGALCVAVLSFLAMCWVQYATTLSPLEQYYFPATYAKTAVRAQQSPTNRANYEVL